MPSQSRREGESTPLHWTRTESPDLDSFLGNMVMETEEDDEANLQKKKKKMMMKNRRGVRGLILD